MLFLDEIRKKVHWLIKEILCIKDKIPTHTPFLHYERETKDLSSTYVDGTISTVNIGQEFDEVVEERILHFYQERDFNNLELVGLTIELRNEDDVLILEYNG